MLRAQASAFPAERRVHVRLREVFDEALELVRPFFDGNEIWCGVPLHHLAQRMLRERYPDLTNDEIYVFVTAAKRVYAVQRKADQS
jgi:hypothetical protein